MKRPLPNTYWVEPGRLLAGEHPAGETGVETAKRLQRLLAAGVNCFVDLTQPDELPDYRPLLPDAVSHHRHPLIDHGVPSSTAEMRAVLQTLDQALSRGQVVYLHCRAGIGRTGLSVACLLIEQGQGSHAALERLNELWQENARSAQWPRIPENEAQEAFVLQWRAAWQVPERASRVRGALLGLAVGDALSAPAQGLKPGEFTPVTALAGGGPLLQAAGAWSDDTRMALCVAESLLETGGVDARDQMSRYRRWLQDGHLTCTGQATGSRESIRKAVALAGWRRSPVLGSHDPKQLDCEPLGRSVASALYYHGSFEAAVAAGADAARVTHQAPLVVDACRLFTGMVHRALSGHDKGAILGLAQHWPLAPLKPELVELAGRFERPARRRRPRMQTILTVLEEVAQAFARGEDFAAGVLGLVNQGGEADVSAAAFGQLAGAYSGLQAIPQPWQQGLLAQETLARFADRLLQSPGV
jgi:ADP-ribosylglycohydrolase